MAWVDDLYDQIENLLAEPISEKAVVIQRRAKELSENHIGTYKIDELILLVGNKPPRGPRMEIRPRPEQIRGWALEAGLSAPSGEAIDLSPYHYGMAF